MRRISDISVCSMDSITFFWNLSPNTQEMAYILTFLEKQGLIEYVEEDEMVKTSKKLDNLMDWNLLNQNNYQRVRKVLEHE